MGALIFLYLNLFVSQKDRHHFNKLFCIYLTISPFYLIYKFSILNDCVTFSILFDRIVLLNNRYHISMISIFLLHKGYSLKGIPFKKDSLEYSI